MIKGNTLVVSEKSYSKILSFIKILLVLLATVIFLYGCSAVENPLWNNEPVPVVYSVITPNQPIQLYLGKSYSENDTVNTCPYPEAKVYVCGDDSIWIEMKRSEKGSTIFTDSTGLLKVVKGGTYSLRVDLNDRTVHSQTTVPNELGEITGGICIVTSDKEGGNTNGHNYTQKRCNLNVNYSLPITNSCFLSAFSNRIGTTPFLSGKSFQYGDFIIPYDSTTVTVNIITVDSALKNFMMSELDGSMMFDSDDITSIIGSFGGVRPSFSNIKNGVGIFSSFVISSKLIFVTQLIH
jgi:hypothetical protein